MESCFRLNDPLHNARLAIASDSHYIILANQSQERCVYICVCNAIRESDLRRVARCVPGDAEACYAALGKRMDAEIHALSMRTLTPEEYRSNPNG